MADQHNFQGIPQHTLPFDAIRHIDGQGNKYWSAQQLGRILGYTEYNKFKNVIHKAEEACKESGQAVSDHFAQTSEMIATGKGARRKVDDVHLSRYACYLLVQNADPTGKPIVSLGQTYFAAQTRRQELADQFSTLPEGQMRLVLRTQMAIDNQKLNGAARQAEVISPSDFATFTDHGYRGLYGGLTENAIYERKNLAPAEHILDYMPTSTL